MNTKVQREDLGHWLREWRLWQVVGQAVGQTVGQEAAAPASSSLSEALPPAEGQIRLWDVEGEPRLALLLAADYGSFHLLPFSPLGERAVPEERFFQDRPWLRVLQGWNRRRCRRAGLEGSLFCEQLEESDLWPLRLWLQQLEAGQGGDPELARLELPDDPRWSYIEQEEQCWSQRLGEMELFGELQEELPRAAEDEADWDTES